MSHTPLLITLLALVLPHVLYHSSQCISSSGYLRLTPTTLLGFINIWDQLGLVQVEPDHHPPPSRCEGGYRLFSRMPAHLSLAPKLHYLSALQSIFLVPIPLCFRMFGTPLSCNRGRYRRSAGHWMAHDWETSRAMIWKPKGYLLVSIYVCSQEHSPCSNESPIYSRWFPPFPPSSPMTTFSLHFSSVLPSLG